MATIQLPYPVHPLRGQQFFPPCWRNAQTMRGKGRHLLSRKDPSAILQPTTFPHGADKLSGKSRFAPPSCGFMVCKNGHQQSTSNREHRLSYVLRYGSSHSIAQQWLPFFHLVFPFPPPHLHNAMGVVQVTGQKMNACARKSILPCPLGVGVSNGLKH